MIILPSIPLRFRFLRPVTFMTRSTPSGRSALREWSGAGMSVDSRVGCAWRVVVAPIFLARWLRIL